MPSLNVTLVPHDPNIDLRILLAIPQTAFHPILRMCRRSTIYTKFCLHVGVYGNLSLRTASPCRNMEYKNVMRQGYKHQLPHFFPAHYTSKLENTPLPVTHPSTTTMKPSLAALILALTTASLSLAAPMPAPAAVQSGLEKQACVYVLVYPSTTRRLNIKLRNYAANITTNPSLLCAEEGSICFDPGQCGDGTDCNIRRRRHFGVVCERIKYYYSVSV